MSIKQWLQGVFEDEKQLLKVAIGVSVLWVAAQIILIVCFWGHPQKSDMGTYISLAQRCFANKEWYPMAEDVYSSYMFAPGFINYLILQLNIFDTVNFNAVLNLFLNIAMLFEVYYLGKKIFSRRTGLISAIIFCLLYSNLIIVIGANTENPFLFLCLSALCLVFSGKWKYVAPAAILFALANWIRPLAIIFLFTSIVYFVITKAKIYNYASLIIPYILVLFIIGTVTEKKIGYFVYQSTTSGINLLMTSHNKATGAYYKPGSGSDDVFFIENSGSVSFAEKDSIWKSRAIMWIKEHPGRYITLFFKKIPMLYYQDAWGRMSYIDPDIMPRHTLKDIFIGERLNRVLLSIPYHIILLFFFCVLWINRKMILSVKSIFLVILITGTVITCIFPAGPRYHYPFIFPIIIYAAWGIDTMMENSTKRRRE